jgi:uncharacterized delta-60 repeat protein
MRALLALTLFGLSLPSLAQSGGLDPSFGNGGKVISSVAAGSDKARGMTVQKNGRVVAVGEAKVGSAREFAVLRYLPDGQLDPSFNGTGMVTTDISTGDDYAYGIAEQKDGKLVAAGWARGNSSIALVRYLSDGQLDPSFGTGGIVTTGLAGWSMGAYGIALDTHGRLLVTAQGVLNFSDYHFLTLRYLPDGSLDGSFGVGGIATTALRNGFPHAILALENGSVLVGGHHQPGAEYVMTLIRYRKDGSLDSAFGNGGIALIEEPNSIVNALIAEPGGKIYAAGGRRISATENEFLLVRLHHDGSPDPSFGVGGLATAPLSASDAPAFGAVRVGASIYLAGQARVGAENQFAFARFRARDGQVEHTAAFAAGGDGDAGARALAYDGKRLIGAGYSVSGGNNDFTLMGVLP